MPNILLDVETVEGYKRRIAELKQQVASLEASLKCETCFGSPISNKPCICGGTGTLHGEVQGFRELVYSLEGELGLLQRTVKHQEDVYLKEHGGSWGECKYKSERDRLREALQ